MAKVELIGNLWIFAGAFVGNLVGGILAAFSLARAVAAGSILRRTVFLAIASWALFESALYDMLFVATTGLSADYVQARYFLPPIIISSLVTILVLTAALFLLLLRPHPVAILAAGALTGVAIAYGSFEGVHSIQSSGEVTVNVRTVWGVAVFAAVTTALTLLVALRVSGRHSAAIAAGGFAVVTTVTQAVTLTAVSFGQPTEAPLPVGLLSVQVIIPITVAFAARLVVLVWVMATDLGATNRADGATPAVPGRPGQRR